MNQSKLIIGVSVFLVACYNLAFFQNILAVYSVNAEHLLFIVSLALFFVCVNVALLSLICINKTTKPVVIAILLVSSLAAYFMDSYNVILNDEMIDNMVKTDLQETLDLLSVKQLLYFLILGVIPSLLIFKLKLAHSTLKSVLLRNASLFFGSIAVMIVMLLSLSNFYASFIREHKTLRFYANPSFYIYSGFVYADSFFAGAPDEVKPIGLDATISPSSLRRKLIVVAVGETVRADRFSLNGYQRETNPLLAKEKVISFDNTWSCGTSTAHSLPCMFSIYPREKFSKEKASASENVLDVLKRVGVNVLWLDNNSSSKGVADRVEYQNYKSAELNPECDIECRDTGMLANLQGYIDAHPDGDIVIILHQMGSHGPAYYKRYPKQFEKFTPTCNTNRLDQCSREEIGNAYDNSILYTDFFLAQTIGFLKTQAAAFNAGLIYVGDHGESLGEDNLYLHGLPYLIAPDAQKHVPMIMWFAENSDPDLVSRAVLEEQAQQSLSHDNLFHTLLGLIKVKTASYDKRLDITWQEGSVADGPSQSQSQP